MTEECQCAACTIARMYKDVVHVKPFRLFAEDAVPMPFLDIVEEAHEKYLMKKEARKGDGREN